ncbi:hypothetical protein B296_00059191, partial [Ensete ventricosum]
ARRRVTRFQRLGTGITVTNSPSPGALSSQCRLSGSEAIVVAKMVISLRWQPLQRDQLVVITTTERLSLSDRSNARQLQKEKEELQKKQGRATAPKAVDEDLYKIPPELRRQKPKRVFITLTREDVQESVVRMYGTRQALPQRTDVRVHFHRIACGKASTPKGIDL